MSLEQFEKKIDPILEKMYLCINEIISNYPKINKFDSNFEKEINNLKNEISKIKKGEISKENLTQIKYDLNQKSPYFLNSKKEKEYLSIGEINSGVIWKNNYYLSFDSFRENKEEGVYQYEEYLKLYTEQKTLEILNKYIYEEELKENYNKDLFKKNAYENSLKESNRNFSEMRSGKLAEKLVQSFLIRIFAENKEIDAQINEVNIYQDVENKIDFIIKTKTHKRGVGIDSDEIDEEKIRKIQFTINSSTLSSELKNKQLENLNDVILVKIPEFEVGKIMKNWKERRESRINPDKFIDKETKTIILENILKGFIEEEKLDKIKKSAII